tara:strand:- start:168 stop:1187 length:1020 start_codon:yes stop_codon:yes gene_type:complete
MQTRTYGDLFNLVKSLAGVNAFTTEEQSDISRFINRRYFQAYNMSQNWVRYLVAGEEKKVSSFTLSGLDTIPVNTLFSTSYYKLGVDSNNRDIYFPVQTNTASEYLFRINSSTLKWEFIYVNGNSTSVDADGVVSFVGSPASNILTQTDAVVNNTPLASPTNVVEWTVGASFAGYPIIESNSLVSYVEDYFHTPTTSTGKTKKEEVGEFLRVHRTQPLRRDSALEYDFFVDINGANILSPIPADSTVAYATYKRKFEPFTVPASLASTSTAEVPEEFFAFIAHAVYADFLRMDGQHQKAIVEEGIAQDALDLQLERNDIISNSNNATRKFSTYVNKQSR